MQNPSSKTNYNNYNPLIEKAKINRMPSKKHNAPASVYYHPQYTEAGKKGEIKLNAQKQKNTASGSINSIIDKILRLLKSDEGLLIILILLFIYEDPEDELLIPMLVYLLISGW